ncbi:integrase core domain-containing protein [Mesorhizobium sp. LNJC405B00]|uniref:integrase core domain-containing protein n=1 Tax=unclassified Mesorhizobium TaxID=325217 RepID=UPI001FDAC8FA|nr:integrase core domain-containing protein [Mesorhizobium sp. LNJC405B00]
MDWRSQGLVPDPRRLALRTLDGDGCVEPLSLALEATGSTADSEAWPVFERLFEEHGLPDRFRSDNGPPFASAGVTGLTPLVVRFIKLGITLERIAPGRPQQNGRHERFHLTMLPMAEAPEADRTAQGQAFETFRQSYNEERPHEALGMDTPAQHYRSSQRAMPRTPPEPVYPAEASVRRVRHNGEIRWNGGFIYVSQALAGEPVAALETEDGQWTLSFHAHPLGIIDTRHMKLVRRSAAPTNPLGAAADA